MDLVTVLLIVLIVAIVVGLVPGSWRGGSGLAAQVLVALVLIALLVYLCQQIGVFDRR